MVPKPSEQNPKGFNAPEKTLGLSEAEQVVTPSTKQEQFDQTSVDLIREKLVSESAGLAATQTNTQPAQTPQTQTSSTSQLSSLPPEEQIHHLVNLAHTSGLDHAFKMANATNNAYVIDRFHDELVNRVLHNKQQSM